MTCHFVVCLLLLRPLVLSLATLLPQVTAPIGQLTNRQLLKDHVLFYSSQQSLNILIYQMAGNINTYINNYKAQVINNNLTN